MFRDMTSPSNSKYPAHPNTVPFWSKQFTQTVHCRPKHRTKIVPCWSKHSTPCTNWFGVLKEYRHELIIFADYGYCEILNEFERTPLGFCNDISQLYSLRYFFHMKIYQEGHCILSERWAKWRWCPKEFYQKGCSGVDAPNYFSREAGLVWSWCPLAF